MDSQPLTGTTAKYIVKEGLLFGTYGEYIYVMVYGKGTEGSGGSVVVFDGMQMDTLGRIVCSYEPERVVGARPSGLYYLSEMYMTIEVCS